MPDNELPGLTRSQDLLGKNSSAVERTFEIPLINAAAYQLIQTPLDAVAQVIDKTSGTNILPSLRIIQPMQKAEFGTGDWYQQQIGGALGSLPYLMAIHKVTRGALADKMLTADTKLMVAAGVKVGLSGAAQLARLELASAGITGLAYGGLLTPVRPEDMATTGSMLEAKAANAAVGAGAFLTLSATMMGLKSSAQLLKPGLAQTLLKSDMGAGAIAGLPAGAFSAQADSLLHKKKFASWQETTESMVGFSTIGGLFPGMQKVLDGSFSAIKTVDRATNVIPIEKVTPVEAAQLMQPGEAPRVKPIERIFTPEQIAKINGWKDAQSKLSETTFRQTEPDRIQKLADEAYGNGAERQERKLHILLGNCGAGKSRVTDALARELGAMTPDSDHIKAKIPGYDEGMGNQAVHEDSTAAYGILLERALKNGDNIVWQGVGKTAKSVTELIAKAKEHKYEVVVHMIDAPPEVAAQRVFKRAEAPPDPQTGIRQMIPPEVPLLEKYQYVPRQNFFRLVGEAAQQVQSGGPKMIDGFRMWRSTADIHASLLPSAVMVPNFTPGWIAPVRTSEEIPQGGMFKVKN